MSSRSWLSLALLLGGIGAVTLVPAVVGQDPKSSAARRAGRPPDGETLRRAQELSRTTAAHDRLARLAGKWNLTLRSPLADKVREDKGTVVGQPILGGRYILLNFRLSLLGRDVEAVQIVGFDTLHGRYTSSWRDNQATWPVECAGAPGKDAEVLDLSGSLHDAKAPDGQPIRLTIDLRQQDQVNVRIHTGVGDKATLMQEQLWRR